MRAERADEFERANRCKMIKCLFKEGQKDLLAWMRGNGQVISTFAISYTIGQAAGYIAEHPEIVTNIIPYVAKVDSLEVFALAGGMTYAGGMLTSRKLHRKQFGLAKVRFSLLDGAYSVFILSGYGVGFAQYCEDFSKLVSTGQHILSASLPELFFLSCATYLVAERTANRLDHIRNYRRTLNNG